MVSGPVQQAAVAIPAAGSAGRPLCSAWRCSKSVHTPLLTFHPLPLPAALYYKWVYLKDDDTEQDSVSFPGTPIPLDGAAGQAIDPLASQGDYPKSYTVSKQ